MVFCNVTISSHTVSAIQGWRLDRQKTKQERNCWAPRLSFDLCGRELIETWPEKKKKKKDEKIKTNPSDSRWAYRNVTEKPNVLRLLEQNKKRWNWCRGGIWLYFRLLKSQFNHTRCVHHKLTFTLCMFALLIIYTHWQLYWRICLNTGGVM